MVLITTFRFFGCIGSLVVLFHHLLLAQHYLISAWLLSARSVSATHLHLHLHHHRLHTMAPRTRRSTGAAKALAAAMALDELEAADQRQQELVQTSTDPPKRRRGRPAKNQPVIPVVAGSSDSASSAPTPLTNTSDGEYSTPATSTAVTPAPPAKDIINVSASTTISSSRPRRSRLTLELPDDPLDDDDIDEVPLRSSTHILPQRQRRSVPSYNDESDEYTELYGEDDQSASAALARRLQREEDQKASTTSLSIPVKRKGVKELSIAGDSESDPLPNRLSRANLKRTRVISSHNDSESESVATNLHRQPRKRQKTFTKAVTTSQNSALNSDVDDDDDDDNDNEVNDVEIISLSDEDSVADLSDASGSSSDDIGIGNANPIIANATRVARQIQRGRSGGRRARNDRIKLEENHPELITMWKDLENMPDLNAGIATQPSLISLQLKPFQLQGLAWMKAMEKTPWKGGLLGDEMGLGKTIQAVSLIMSDYPVKIPTLVLLPPVALGQWQDEIATYTGKKLKTIVFHGTNAKAKNLTAKELKKFDVIIMSYNSLESLYRKQEKGIKRKDGLYKEKSVMHQIKFHRVILDEAHCIKVRLNP